MVTQVALFNFVRERSITIQKFKAFLRFDDNFPRCFHLVIWIVFWVDVDGHTVAVFRYASARRNRPLVKSRGVIVAHRGLVIATVMVDEAHSFDGITRLEQGFENLQQIIGNHRIANHLANDGVAVRITM